jgi:hypothetical protein
MCVCACVRAQMKQARAAHMSMTTTAVSAGSHDTGVLVASHSSRPVDGMNCCFTVSARGTLAVALVLLPINESASAMQRNGGDMPSAGEVPC